METRRARTKVVVSLLALVGLLGLSPLAMAEDPVYFADANLKAAVERQLGISDPTPTNMLSLTRLYAGSRGILDLTGIEYATNVNELCLNFNQISDISVLSGLANLLYLFLHNNQVTDISPLSGLTNLRHLGLGGMQISDISVLSGLTNLEHLGLFDNQITDISPLSGLNMTDLQLHNNQISDISPLSGMTYMRQLWLGNNQISDISPLSGLNPLHLYLHDNQISDISSLSGMTNLVWLDLHNNQISDISSLSEMTNLVWLFLHDNQIGDISPLSGMTNLWELDLRGNPLNVEAYCTYLPLIKANNRRFGNRPLWYDSIELSYDPNPNPEDCDSCAMEQVYGESSEETELLRYFRDHVLSQTPEGRQIIRLYYQWSPVIVRRMEQDEEFRSQVKKIIDGILPFIRARTE